MDLEWKPSMKGINGVNLANYFPHQRSYNSVVYIHKKYLDVYDYKYPEVMNEKPKPKKEKKCKQDKGQQFNCDKNTEISNDKTYKICNNHDSVLEHTIRFAKKLVPLVIPPSDENLPVFYTIKSKNHRKKEKKPQETSFEQGATYDKGESKKVIETYRKIRKGSFSVKESVSHSSSNTLDDLNINQSLCCTLSEVSEKKYHRKDLSHHKKRIDGPKFAVSESFEALATENPGESKIKIQLMNEKDKHYLTDSIKSPILTAIRECISELSNCNQNSDITMVQRILKCNTNKLDKILEKISSIENKLELQARESTSDSRISETKGPRKKMLQSKSSALEELEADLIECKEDYTSEEEIHQEMLDRRSKSVVTEIVLEDKSQQKMSTLGGGGEITGGLKDSASACTKVDRPSRIPARFCWTDAARK